MRHRVLVIEDEPEMQMILRDNLEVEGYQVLPAETGEEGVGIALTQRPDLILLDLMLPRMSGYEVCRKVRGAGFHGPIIMITARNAELDRIAGLELGANDYVGKPFSVRELLARVRVHLLDAEYGEPRGAEYRIDDFVVNFDLREVRRVGKRRRGKRLDLSSLEFDLLEYFITHRGQVVTREQLLSDVWGYAHVPATRTVDNFVAKLRRKIEPERSETRYILTVHGTGYRFLA